MRLIAETFSGTPFAISSPMDSGRPLAEEIAPARTRKVLDAGRSDYSLGLFPSLRKADRAVPAGLHPRKKDAGHLFTLTMSPIGEHLFLQGGQPVPVDGPSLPWSAPEICRARMTPKPLWKPRSRR